MNVIGLNQIIVFYPKVFCYPMHGWHNRAIQVLRELASTYRIIIATLDIESGFSPEQHDANQAADLLHAQEIHLFSRVSDSWLDSKLYRFTSRLERSRLVRHQPLLREWVETMKNWQQRQAQKRWFQDLVRKREPRLIVLFFAGWEYLLDGVSPLIPKALELHDLIPISDYLHQTLESSLTTAKGQPSFSGIGANIRYINDKEELPLRVALEVSAIAASLNNHFDAIWMICDREAQLLRQFQKKLPIEIMLPSYPLYSKEGIEKKNEREKEFIAFPLMPLGPNIFNLYSLTFFIKAILPYLDPPQGQRIRITGRVWGDFAIPESHIIEYVGVVSNFQQVLRDSAFIIAPTRIGTGQQTKIFEALSAGTPVVTYKDAIPPEIDNPEIGILAASNDTELIAIINMLWRDPKAMAKLRNDAIKGQQMVSVPSGYERAAEKLICKGLRNK